MILPFTSADLITPGFHSIPVINNITNFDDFSDYEFISICQNPMFSASLIKNGNIVGCYKYSELDVYIVLKKDFNEDYLNNLSQSDSYAGNGNLTFAYLNSLNAIKVLDNIEHYVTVPDASTQKEIINYYNISLKDIKTNPDKRDIERNNLIYFYISASIIALIIIIMLLIRKYKHESSA
jgi:hypothetical protein